MEFGKVLKTFSSKGGKSVTIQAVAKTDLNSLLDFINGLIAEDTYIYRETDKPVTLEEEAQWLDNAMNQMGKGNQFYFVAKAEGRIVGVGNIIRGWMREQEQGRFRMSIAKDYREQGIGTEMMKMGIVIGKEMSLKLLKSWLFADDEKAVYLAKKCGFVEGGKLPQSVRFKDGYTDEILMYCLLNVYAPQYGTGSTSEGAEVDLGEDDIV